MTETKQIVFKFPCTVVFSDLGWELFGQKKRHPVKNRTGTALGIGKGRWYKDHIRVKWEGVKSIQYYPVSYLTALTKEELTINGHENRKTNHRR